VYCISRLRFSDIGGMAEVDEQRVCIKEKTKHWPGYYIHIFSHAIFHFMLKE